MISERYEAVIIGSGFGAAAAAYELVQAGVQTLMVERGGWVERDAGDWEERQILIEQRYQGKTPLRVKQDDRPFTDMPVNEAVGGMSVFYGGASLRLRERDFDRWPLDYADLEPFYSEAEQLLGVHGDPDAAGEPPRSVPYAFPSEGLTLPAQRLHGAAQKVGFKPNRIPLALNFSQQDRPLCIKCTTCDGFPCRIQAKNDVTTNLLYRAQSRGLQIRARVVVDRLVERDGRIEAVECVDLSAGERISFAANVVVLGAGAIQSPAILLRSELDRLDESNSLGRYLMRHCNAVVSYLFPFRTNPQRVFHKQLCFTDFYEDRRDDLGTAVGILQDIYTPGAEVIGHFAPTGLGWIAGAFAGYMQNLLCIAEDDAQFDNAVSVDSEADQFGIQRVRVEHRYSEQDFARRDYLIGKAKKVLKAAGGLIPYVYEIDTFSHAVGTVRMGASPEEGVVDEDGQFWELENLYAVDGSVMPTSAGVNPSLTIVANGLRVGREIGVRERA